MNFKTTTVEQAYAYIGKARIVIPELPDADTRNRLQSQLDLETFIEAVNRESNGGEPWVPDYEDDNRKYEPWFFPVKSDKHPLGFVFSCTDCGYTRTSTACGSRFAFHSYDAWKHAVSIPEVIDLFLTVWTKK